MNFIKISKVIAKAGTYNLSPPITLNIKKDEVCYIAEYPKFNMYLCGRSIQDLRNDFDIEIEFLYENYALCDDDLLTPGAIELKNALLKQIQFVPN